MNQVLTLSCKLQVLPEQVVLIDDLLQAFAAACEYTNKVVKPGLTNEQAIQSLVYSDVRAKFGLSSQLTIQAVRRVAGNRKTAKHKDRPVKKFAPTSANYDERVFSFREHDWTVSLRLLSKRARFKLAIGNYQRGLLKGQTPKTATLVKRKDGSYYLNIQMESQPPEVEAAEKVLGCDLGRTDIVVTSEDDKYSGKDITKIRDHYSNLRAKLQIRAAKGTRSSRRRCRELLKRLSGKERRFQSHTNHTISYQLVQKAKIKAQIVALEDLTGIRQRTNEMPRTKLERRRSNSWSFFYQLRQFLTYKCIKFGVKLVLVNPAYTSKMCHCCLHIHPVPGKSYRSGKSFRCDHCRWFGDADLNGAINISVLGRLIDSPRGSGLACSLEQHVLGLLKTSSSALGRAG